VQASVAQRAVAAARSTASTFDLPVDATVVLNDSNRLVVRLMPCDVVARVTPPEALAPVTARASWLSADGASEADCSRFVRGKGGQARLRDP
jgi:hypothetical protein